MISAYSTNNPFVIRHLLSIMVALAEVLREDEKMLLDFIQKMFSAITFCYPNEQNFIQRGIILSEETRYLRSKAVGSLIKLATALPNHLMAMYNNFYTSAIALAEAQSVTNTEKNKLIEFLLTIIKQQAFQTLMDPVISAWIAEFESLPESVSDALGLRELATYVGKLNGRRHTLKQIDPGFADFLKSKASERQKITGSFQAMTMWLKRTVPNGQKEPYIASICEKCLQWMSRIHSITDPAAFAGPLEIVSVVRSALTLDISKKLDIPSKTELETVQNSLELWTLQMRDHTHALFGTLCSSQALYEVSGIAETFLGTVFASAEHFENKLWKRVIVAVAKPFITGCPQQYRSTIIPTVLSPLVSFLGLKLSNEWKELVDAGLKASEEDDVDMTDETLKSEIGKERLLRDFTRSYVDFLLSMILATNEELSAYKLRKSTPEAQKLFEFTLTSPVAVLVVQGLLQVMVFKDVIASRKIVTYFTRLLPVAGQPPLSEFFGRNIFIAALEVFHDGYFTDMHNECLGLISQIYWRLRDQPESAAITRATLLSLPSINERVLADFEQQVEEKGKDKKTLNALFRLLLRDIKGVAVSRTHTESVTFFGEQPKLIRPRRRRDVLNEEDGEGGPIS
ncbi:hypothetical protein DFJ73DRAFT_521110 [Zopfochytrium polystomum]|nr:hypothetical protein DFJ73DRAFT_521110 [Zopfochytrium polystomum]